MLGNWSTKENKQTKKPIVGHEFDSKLLGRQKRKLRAEQDSQRP